MFSAGRQKFVQHICMVYFGFIDVKQRVKKWGSVYDFYVCSICHINFEVHIELGLFSVSFCFTFFTIAVFFCNFLMTPALEIGHCQGKWVLFSAKQSNSPKILHWFRFQVYAALERDCCRFNCSTFRLPWARSLCCLSKEFRIEKKEEILRWTVNWANSW